MLLFRFQPEISQYTREIMEYAQLLNSRYEAVIMLEKKVYKTIELSM